MRSPPQKVTGYEEETACEQRPRDFKGGMDPLVSPFSLYPFLPAPRHSRFALVSQLPLLDASSFLIAANRDVKTIRALLLDSEPDAQFFSRYRGPPFAPALSLSLSLSLAPLVFPEKSSRLAHRDRENVDE